MTARDEVLARIRTALGPARKRTDVPRAYRQHREPEVALFAERVADYRATVYRCDPAALPNLLARLLPGRTVVPAGVPDAWLAGLDIVHDQPPLSAHDLDRLDAVLTTSAVAIAETGTVVLDGSHGQGRRALTLVPDHHVVVVTADQVVADVPDALRRLDPTRALTWISGPSATSDIELDRVEGVHGPRRLDVVLVENGCAPST